MPSHVIGAAGQTPPSERINVGFIGVGSQGLRVMLNFLKQPDVQGVAVCDPNTQSADYPQWGQDEFCNGVRRLLETNSGWEWLSPNKPIKLTRTMVCSSGVAGREPARKIVDAYYAKQKRSGQYSACAAYADYRAMLEAEKDLDAVVVGTTDHLHAAVSVAALNKGKHVYCQKPMAHSVYEAWQMAEAANKSGKATQVAVGNQASEDTRRLCEWVSTGTIGAIQEVINWSARPFWPQGLERPKETERVPEGMDWDLWLGPSPQRPFHHVYLPFVWRGWHDFGCGAIGDMGCYSFDTIYRVLKPEGPVSVEGSSSERYPESFPSASMIQFKFQKPNARLTWYDGGLMPWKVPELEGKPLPKEGLWFLGEKGSILCGFTGNNPVLLPESKMKDFKEPPKTLPRSAGNEREWLDACKGGKDKPGANFEFSAAVTEALLLGNAAVQTGEQLTWQHGRLLTGVPAAQKIIHPEFRKGWNL